jgi:hypothetical protein
MMMVARNTDAIFLIVKKLSFIKYQNRTGITTNEREKM